MAKKKWMQKLHLHKGAFTLKAKKAGMSVHQYALKMQHAPGKTGKQARLALVFAKARH